MRVTLVLSSSDWMIPICCEGDLQSKPLFILCFFMMYKETRVIINLFCFSVIIFPSLFLRLASCICRQWRAQLSDFLPGGVVSFPQRGEAQRSLMQVYLQAQVLPEASKYPGTTSWPKTKPRSHDSNVQWEEWGVLVSIYISCSNLIFKNVNECRLHEWVTPRDGTQTVLLYFTACLVKCVAAVKAGAFLHRGVWMSVCHSASLTTITKFSLQWISPGGVPLMHLNSFSSSFASWRFWFRVQDMSICKLRL